MYTDSYDQKEENYDENYTTNNSSNALKIIFVVVLLAILLTLLFFVIKGRIGSSNKKDNYTLNLYPDKIVVPLGKTQTISFDVRNNGIIVPNAVINLSVEDTNIAKVDSYVITGLNYGKTKINAKYVNDGDKLSEVTKELIVGDGDPNVLITNILFPNGDLKMSTNGSYDFNLEIEPSNGFIENKIFSSSNTNVVKVDNFGHVTAVGEGNAIITIDINNGKYKHDINVYVSSDNDISNIVVSPTDVKINSTINTLKVGEMANLDYSVLPSNADNSVTWSSSDNSIIAVDYRGKITALSEGMATITVTTSNNLSDSLNIQVEKKEIPVNQINLSIIELTMNIGESQMVVPVIDPIDATDTLTYNTDNPSVVSLIPSSDGSNVTITALATGKAKITIQASNGVNKTFDVSILDNSNPQGGGNSSGNNGGSGGGCASNNNIKCSNGKYAYCGKCYNCPAGNYCANNKKNACPAGKGSVANSSSYQDCTYCAKGYYATGDGKGCVACSNGKTTKSSGSTSKNDCNVTITPTPIPTATPVKSTGCASNEYKSGGICHTCEAGYRCNGITRIKCEYGYISIKGVTKCTACSTGKSNDERTQCIR